MNTEHTLEEQNIEIIQPFQPKNLFNLFFKPKTFFLSRIIITIKVLC